MIYVLNHETARFHIEAGHVRFLEGGVNYDMLGLFEVSIEFQI